MLYLIKLFRYYKRDHLSILHSALRKWRQHWHLKEIRDSCAPVILLKISAAHICKSVTKEYQIQGAEKEIAGARVCWIRKGILRIDVTSCRKSAVRCRWIFRTLFPSSAQSRLHSKIHLLKCPRACMGKILRSCRWIMDPLFRRQGLRTKLSKTVRIADFSFGIYSSTRYAALRQIYSECFYSNARNISLLHYEFVATFTFLTGIVRCFFEKHTLEFYNSPQ